jgi:uncharacterized phiE125 gp8 family phage protein
MFEPTWSISLSVPPSGGLLTLAQAKAQCTVDDDITADDTLLSGYLIAAADVVEDLAERAFRTQTRIRSSNGFPCSNREPIVLPWPPLQGTPTVQYRDTSGVLQTWDSSKYRVITTGRFAVIVPAFGQVYPQTTDDPDAVTITFTCGYADPEDVPERYMLAQRLLVAHWYAKREPVEISNAMVNKVPCGLDTVIGAPARVDPCW